MLALPTEHEALERWMEKEGVPDEQRSALRPQFAADVQEVKAATRQTPTDPKPALAVSVSGRMLRPQVLALLKEGDELLARMEKPFESFFGSSYSTIQWDTESGTMKANPPDARRKAYTKAMSAWTDRVTDLLATHSLDLVDSFLGDPAPFFVSATGGIDPL